MKIHYEKKKINQLCMNVLTPHLLPNEHTTSSITIWSKRPSNFDLLVPEKQKIESITNNYINIAIRTFLKNPKTILCKILKASINNFVTLHTMYDTKKKKKILKFYILNYYE